MDHRAALRETFGADSIRAEDGAFDLAKGLIEEPDGRCYVRRVADRNTGALPFGYPQ